MKKIYSVFVFIIVLIFGGCDNINEPISPVSTASTSSDGKNVLAKGYSRNNDSHKRNCDNDHDRDEDCNSKEWEFHNSDCDRYHDDDDRCNHDRRHTDGCNRQHEYWKSCATNSVTSTCDADGIVTLWAGKTINVGSVTVTQDQNNLYVKYSTTGSWKLKATHLDISTQKYTQRGSPGQYDYQANHNNGATVYTYTVPKTWTSGTTIYLLPHAVVGKYSYQECGSTQSAFGGTVVQPQNGSWYATFCCMIQGTPPPPTYTISGFTFADANSNGVKDVGEAALANITVLLSNGGTAISNSNGLYSFSGVAAGSYTVTAPSVSGYTQPSPASASLMITNANGSANFGYKLIPIPTIFSISGHIYNDLNLNGIRDVGEPGISGAVVALNVTTTATTDVNGNYVFSNLNAGTYIVTPKAILDLNLTTIGSLTIVLTNSNATAIFGFAQYSIPDMTKEALKEQ